MLKCRLAVASMFHACRRASRVSHAFRMLLTAGRHSPLTPRPEYNPYIAHNNQATCLLWDGGGQNARAQAAIVTVAMLLKRLRTFADVLPVTGTTLSASFADSPKHCWQSLRCDQTCWLAGWLAYWGSPSPCLPNAALYASPSFRQL